MIEEGTNGYIEALEFAIETLSTSILESERVIDSTNQQLKAEVRTLNKLKDIQNILEFKLQKEKDK